VTDEYLESVKLEEAITLQQTIERIDNKIDGLSHHIQQPGGGLPKAAERSYRVQLQKRINELSSVRTDPYFGRVDFLEDGSYMEPEKFYIGKMYIDIDYVYSWEAPIASLYYQDSRTVKGYKVRNRYLPGIITLKRNLEINNCQLRHVSESYRLLLQQDQEEITFEDHLIRRLEEPKSRRLEDIVATIQPQQYEQIAATPEKIMIIQGVAGSGKSEVGLHRIAYLLSPHNELELDIATERVVFLGPSRFFLRYINRLLPGLNIRSVRQTTIQEWITSKLSHSLRLRRRDWLYERLLTLTKSSLDNDLKITRFKNSIEMAKLLNRYIESTFKNILQKTTDIRANNSVIIYLTQITGVVK